MSRERETETETDRDRDRERETDRQTDRDTDKTETQTDRLTEGKLIQCSQNEVDKPAEASEGSLIHGSTISSPSARVTGPAQC